MSELEALFEAATEARFTSFFSAYHCAVIGEKTLPPYLNRSITTSASNRESISSGTSALR
jgi:hypothetical protein